MLTAIFAIHATKTKQEMNFIWLAPIIADCQIILALIERIL